MFYNWLNSSKTDPYNSYGNGSAMRISSCGWYFDDLKQMQEAVKKITNITHNHPEGIKGAMVTATCIYLARHGSSKEEIRKYAEKQYDLDLNYEELKRTNYHGEEICQIALPQALYCFFISNSFEDCLRTTVSIGGDTDTLCAISCAIAEAYYGVNDSRLITEVVNKLPEDMKQIITEFNNEIRKEN